MKKIFCKLRFLHNISKNIITVYDGLCQDWQNKTASTKIWIPAIILGFFLFLIFLFPVRNIMEARNFQTVSEILDHGQWWLPTLNDTPRIEKPPLPTWCAAFLAWLANDVRQVWLMRLPNLAMAMAMLFATFLLVQSFAGRRSAIFASCVLATAGQFFGEVAIARWDMFSVSFGMLGIWATWNFVSVHKFRWFCLAVLFWSGAYWSKGPVAFYTMLLPLLLAWLLFGYIRQYFAKKESRRPITNEISRPESAPSEISRPESAPSEISRPESAPSEISRPASAPSESNLSSTPESNLADNLSSKSDCSIPYLTRKDWLAIAALLILVTIIGCSWWLWLKFWYPATLDRISADMDNLQRAHTKNFFYYFYQSPLLVSPWILLFIAGFIFAIHCLYRWKKQLGSFISFSHPIWFTLLWFLISLVLLSFIPFKKNRYFFTILPIATTFIAVFWDAVLTNPQAMKIWYLRYITKLQAYTFAFAWLVLPIAFIIVIWFYEITAWSLLLLILWLLLVPLVFRSPNSERLIYDTSLITIFACILALSILGKTALMNARFSQTYPIVYNITQNKTLYVCSNADEELLWAIGRTAKMVRQIQNLPPASSCFLLVREEDKNTVLQHYHSHINNEPCYYFYERDDGKNLAWFLYEIK